MAIPAHQPNPPAADLLNPESANYNPSQLIDPAVVAQLLNVSTGTLSVWRCTGRYNLPFIKVGRKVMYRVGQVNDFIDLRTRRQAI